MTTEAIIAAAERLFARHGIDGVSLRKIGAAAGTANHYSVQYHFGDRAGLVRAVFERRLPYVESRREALLGEAMAADGLRDPFYLLRALLLPLSEIVDDEGLCSYAAFALNVYWHSDVPPSWLESAEFAPLSKHILRLLQDAVGLPPVVMHLRFRLSTASFLHSVLEWERRTRAGHTSPSRDEMIVDALRFAAAGMVAPHSPS